LDIEPRQEELFPWSEKYQMGIDFADVQHKQLVDQINIVHQALMQAKGRAIVGRNLDDLIRYARAHFAVEENVLQRCGYPDLRQHHVEHELLEYTIFELYENLMSNDSAMSAQGVACLKNWMTQEILGADLKFAAFLKGKELL
jgi:hemerythrin